MEEANKIGLAGQWYGYFSYGPQYGTKLEAEKVIFSLLIEKVFNNQFKGKCIELEGIGANTEVSTIQGFIENQFISFSKEYLTYFTLDEQGNEAPYEESINPIISYSGEFNELTKTFSGTWEIRSYERLSTNGIIADICTGNWEISNDHKKYGL